MGNDEIHGRVIKNIFNQYCNQQLNLKGNLIMSNKIYISGPMTGIKNANRESFNAAQAMLTKKGFVVLNPAVNPAGLTYEEYMRIDMAMLGVCSAIYMLDGHIKSKGATAELAYAKSCDFGVFYEGSVLLAKRPDVKLPTYLTTEIGGNL